MHLRITELNGPTALLTESLGCSVHPSPSENGKSWRRDSSNVEFRVTYLFDVKKSSSATGYKTSRLVRLHGFWSPIHQHINLTSACTTRVCHQSKRRQLLRHVLQSLAKHRRSKPRNYDPSLHNVTSRPFCSRSIPVIPFLCVCTVMLFSCNVSAVQSHK